jgi:hypothetical protein
MMRKISFLCTVFVLIHLSLLQSKKDGIIDKIRAVYKETNEKISSQQLYCNEFILNRDKLPVSAVGNYQETVQFYYSSNEMLGTYELKKITLKAEHSITRTYAEFLYNGKEELIFYYYRFHNGQGDTTESRCYFNDRELVRLIENQEIIDDIDEKYDPYQDAILERSERLLTLFTEYDGFSLFDVEDLKE